MSKLPYQINPQLGLQLLDDELSQAVPYTKFEYVDVIFNANANGDTDIPHGLNSTDIGYQVVGYSFVIAPAAAPVVYRDISGSARAWQKNYIVLRSNVASVQVSLLLFVKRA